MKLLKEISDIAAANTSGENATSQADVIRDKVDAEVEYRDRQPSGAHDSKPYPSKVKKEFKNKRGDSFPKDAKVVCALGLHSIRVEYNGYAVKMPYRKANTYLTGFRPEPTLRALEKMSYDGIATTPLGNRVEPDGYGPYGDPSWLIVNELI